jgi:hypothetical protein
MQKARLAAGLECKTQMHQTGLHEPPAAAALMFENGHGDIITGNDGFCK